MSNKNIKIINSNKIKRILVAQFTSMGDVLLSAVVLEPLKKAIPDAEITFLVKNPYQEAIVDHPFLDKIIVLKHHKNIKYYTERLKLYKNIYSQKFDLVICLALQNHPGIQQVALFSGAKYRIGYDMGQFSFAFNYRLQKPKDYIYSALRRKDLLKPLGIEEMPINFHYPINLESINFIESWLKEVGLINKDFIVLSPGSPEKRKMWRLDYFAQLGDLIHETYGIPIIISGARNEQEYKKTVYDLMKHKPIISPETTLNQAVALLKCTKLLICNDGGLNHFSCISETNTIAIFGPTNPDKWSPANIFEHHHHMYKPGFPSAMDNSFGITPGDVIEKIKEIDF